MLKVGDKVSPLQDIYTPVRILKAHEVFEVVGTKPFKHTDDYALDLKVPGFDEPFGVMRTEVVKVKHEVVE